MKLSAPWGISIAEELQDMPEKKPTIQEFEYHPNAVIHVPTGATWTMRPGSTEIRSFKPSKLGVVLPDGTICTQGDVQALARVLIQWPRRPDLEEPLRPKRGRPRHPS